MIEEGLAHGTSSPPSHKRGHCAVASMPYRTFQVRLSKMLGGTVITPGFHQPESDNKLQISMLITTMIRRIAMSTLFSHYYDNGV